MTLALLMEGVYKTFSQRRLRCDDCKKEPELKRARGCGVPPIDANGRQWNPDAFLRQALERGWPLDYIAVQAELEYDYANVGDIWEVNRELWPCCPRFFYEFAHPAAKVVARRALKLARSRRHKDPEAAREGPLTSAGLELLETATSAWGQLEREYLDRENARKNPPQGSAASSWKTAGPVRRGGRRGGRRR